MADESFMTEMSSFFFFLQAEEKKRRDSVRRAHVLTGGPRFTQREAEH